MVTAVVVSGAGARGAYEAGVLSVVLPELNDDTLIVVGTSAGAINAAVMASQLERGAEAAARSLQAVWRELTARDVFNIRLRELVALVSELTTLDKLPLVPAKPLPGLLDTTPLRQTVLSRPEVDWKQLNSQVGKGKRVRTLAMVASSLEHGTAAVFLAGEEPSPANRVERGLYYVRTELKPEHVLASSAIPLLFPCIEVPGHGYFMDGGVHLNTPIVPALDLQADRILVVATHPDPLQPIEKGTMQRQPDIFDQAASLLTTLLVDRVAEDVRSLRRVNAALQAVDRQSVQDPRPRHAGRELLLIEHAYFGPPQADVLRRLAAECYRRNFGGWFRMPSRERFLGRLLGTGDSSDELLSFLLFDPSYMRALVERGAQDAKALIEKNGGKLPFCTLG